MSLLASGIGLSEMFPVAVALRGGVMQCACFVCRGDVGPEVIALSIHRTKRQKMKRGT